MNCKKPQDTIKTRAQTAAHGAFKGPMDIATQTIHKEGFLALYKGSFPPFLHFGQRLLNEDDSFV